MSNSGYVSYTKISPYKNSPRNHAIDRISIHCVVGQVTMESLGNIFQTKAASSNYGVDKDGHVGMYVEEKDRSWCSDSPENDNRAVTIETASDTTEPYRVNDAAYRTLLNLCEDICRRNGKKKLLWLGDKAKTLAYTPKSDEMVLTVHRWFNPGKSCPGTYLYERQGAIAAEVTKRLGGGSSSVDLGDATKETPVSYLVRVTATDLNIRKGPGTTFSRVGFLKPGTHQIVAEARGTGGAGKWGKLSTGEGWISLDYAEKITTTIPEEDDEMLTYDQWKDYMERYEQEQAKKKEASWAKDAVEYVEKNGFMNGDTDGNFRPQSTITRQEVAATVKNVVEKLKK